ncbi:MAG: CRISPR-associated helicase Cas3' [Pseudomonadota bacterium]
MDDTETGRTMAFFAHSRQDSGKDSWQRLESHLSQVAERAGTFADEFGNGDWARLAGWLHDLGKFNPQFQRYIARQSGYDEYESEDSAGKVDHSTAGAIFAVEKCRGAGRILAYLISGHHTGLPDWFHEPGVGGDLLTRLGKADLLEAIRVHLPDDVIQILDCPNSKPAVNCPAGFHLWIRFLYSCLVDADFLDTETFMDKDRSVLRGGTDTIGVLLEKFDRHMEKLTAGAEDTPVNTVRRSILEGCRTAGKSADRSGVFSLSVPTGGGKTLASMAFALEHARRYKKNQVIMAIPFTSIIEQTAGVYKTVFGEENVIEHHSNVDPEKETQRNSIAAENWDAPVIVTTNVQLFESLFASRSSRCRKLHAIVNSIIILDEAQTIPTEFLLPILSVLTTLVNDFKVTLVLCTATQPALSGRIGTISNGMDGFQDVKEIIASPGYGFSALDRVSLILPNDWQEPVQWDELAAELSQLSQVLCIVNTRKDCRELHKLMPEGTHHLSASMCPEERSHQIGIIKRKLKDKTVIRVISTQLVEAGVDIDFPVVYRALAGFDSIIQAAGRCNREGRMKEPGKVKVFVPPGNAPPGFLRTGQNTTRDLAAVKQLDFSPATSRTYFEMLYSNQPSFDVRDILPKLSKDAREVKIQFRTAARDFKLIDDNGHKAIVIWYENGKVDSLKWIAQLRNKGPSRTLLRRLQRFTVSVPDREFHYYRSQGMVEEIHGFWIQSTHLLYRCGLGIVEQDPNWNGSDFIW